METALPSEGKASFCEQKEAKNFLMRGHGLVADSAHDPA
jgi:hypothetical protein